MAPGLYAWAYGIEPVVFKRWMRTHLIFREENAGSKRRVGGFSRSGTPKSALSPHPAEATEFVAMKVAGEEAAC